MAPHILDTLQGDNGWDILGAADEWGPTGRRSPVVKTHFDELWAHLLAGTGKGHRVSVQ